MTLQQLKYAVVTAEKGTVSEAAASLYIAQPSLTKALKELEKEMGISIFNRTNKGVFGKCFWAMPDKFWSRLL